jgi:soluble lytic murein transglycosylase-like protein
MSSQIILGCLLAAASTYDVPSSVLYSIMEVEGGETGTVSANTNGSYDLGLMQINSLWLPELAKHWGVDETEAAYRVVNDTCTNIDVASWILKKKIAEADGSLINGIAFYHSRTPHLGRKYALKVYDTLEKNNFLEESN